MWMPRFLHHKLARFAIDTINTRSPDETLGPTGRIYLERWFVLPHNRWFNIYIHFFHRSDDDRALHDHPWASISVLLHGAYNEHLRGGKIRKRVQGRWYPRRATSAHRIELLDAFAVGNPGNVVTLFITGPHIREWGFLCPAGWRHWKLFTKSIARGETVGCGEYE